jgi:hypothetical protein
VRDNGLERVVALVRSEGKPFGADPRGGPWASVIKRDADFAAAYARHDQRQYIATWKRIRDALFDRGGLLRSNPRVPGSSYITLRHKNSVVARWSGPQH